MLNKIIALAVSDLVEAMGVANVRIKWPNDVYCGNKKLAGILIENTFRASDLVSTIVGTGINVNQMEFITELKNVSSVQLETGQPYSIQKTAESLHLQIAYWYEQLQQKNVDLINTSYHQRLFRLALPFFYRKGSTKFTGTIKGVSNTGKLIMTSESGETLSFDLKEVEFII